MRHALAGITTFAILAVVNVALSPFTPHPTLVTLLAFALVRSFGLQVRLGRVKRELEFRERSHMHLLSRVDRLEWEAIRPFRRAR